MTDDRAAEFWDLVEERASTTDVEAKRAIDEAMWSQFGAKRAIAFTDLAGFTRNLEIHGVPNFLEMILEQQRVLFPIAEKHNGRVVKAEADSLIVVFEDTTAAIRASVAMQRATERHNERRPTQAHLLLCVGIGFGDVLEIGDHDIFGLEVNAASKLGEEIAQAGEILVTHAAKEAAGLLAGAGFKQLGMQIPGTTAGYALDYERIGDGARPSTF